MARRTAVPRPKARDVEFASDRTCCVCRIPGKRYQIAHIDDDPSNNNYENLAILCFECHDKARQKGGLGRDLSAELIKLYNQTWQELVRLRLLPNEDVRDLAEYRHEVMLEISIICRQWSQTFVLHNKGIRSALDPPEQQTLSYLIDHCTYEHSAANWKDLYTLANDGIASTVVRLERALSLHAFAIPARLKTLLTRALRTLGEFPTTYNLMYMGGVLVKGITQDLHDATIEQPVISFRRAFEVVKDVDDEAHKIRQSLIM